MRTRIICTNDLICFNYFDYFLWNEILDFKKRIKLNSIFFKKYELEIGCFLKFICSSVKILRLDKIFKNRKIRITELYEKIRERSKKRKRTINVLSQNRKEKCHEMGAFVKLKRLSLRNSLFIGQFECFRFTYLPDLYLFTKDRFTRIKKKMKKDFVLFEIMFRNFFEIKKIAIYNNNKKGSCIENLKIAPNSIENQTRIGKIFRGCAFLFLKKKRK